MVSHQPHFSSLRNDDIEKRQLAGQTKNHRLDVCIPAEKYIILDVTHHCKHIWANISLIKEVNCLSFVNFRTSYRSNYLINVITP